MAARGSVAASKVDEFRAIVRAISLDQCMTIGGVLHSTLDSRSTQEPINKKKVVDCKAFSDGLLSVRQIRQKFTPADLADIYNDANEKELTGIDIDDLTDFVQKSISKARVLALKLRNALIKEHHVIDSYRKAFLNICNQTTKVCDRDRFTQFAEDYLRATVTDNDALGMYSLFDMNGDGKVSLDDFCGFMSGRSTEATGLLIAGNAEVIVDIQISNTPQQDSELMRAGYAQVLPTELGGQETKYDVSTQGSFGKGESIWVWRRKQGTCSGRLKPIVDIQLGENVATSSMVVAGYTAVKGSIAGMKLWVRRATTAQDEREAIVALQVSLGNMKNPSDKIWLKPGVDWLRVDANFSKVGIGAVILGNVDAFLWMLPQQVRSTETPGLQGLLRAAGGLSVEKRLEKICKISRTAIRANVPVLQMRNVCNPIDISTFGGVPESSSGGNSELDSATTAINRGRPMGVRAFDFSNLYHDYDQTLDGKMNSQKLYKLLKHSGVWLERGEVNYMFRYIDVNINNSVSREEYARCITLTDFELDECVEVLRAKLRSASSATNDARDSRILSQVFKLVDTDGDGIISLYEFMQLMAALEIYVTEEEARKILHMMDINRDDRVEENDFVSFIKQSSETHMNRAHRLREASYVLRRWLNRGGVSGTDASRVEVVAGAKQWDELKERRQRSRGGTFPNFLDADDILLTCAYLGCWLSPLGSRELVLMISPEQNGRITPPDLNGFMARNARTFGELVALLERDIMKPLFDRYRAYQKAIKNEDPNAAALEADYQKLRKEIVQEVQNTAAAPGSAAARGTVSNASGKGDNYVHDVVSVPQLKGGIEAAMRRYKEFDGRAPSAEEWVNLAVLTGSTVAEDDVYGVDVSSFVEKILPVVAGGLLDQSSVNSQPASMNILVKEIARLIHAEALASGNGGKLNYRAAFNIINKDGDEVLSIEEFRANLVRLQLSHLCPEGELPKLIRLFDTNSKGHVTFDDFMGFVNKYKGLAEDGAASFEVEAEQDDPTKMSDTPPLAITRNADCDYIIWFIWKQCCRIEPSDPECIVTELEAACHESELTQSEGSISIKELWNLLFELKIQTNNNISKPLFEKGIRYLLVDGQGKRAAFDNSQPDAQVDYSALCRYVVRMGRAHVAMRDERQATNLTLYKRLSGELRKFLISLGAADFASGYTPRNTAGAMSEDKMKRVEKVFRRMDSDGDGKLTTLEFKGSLKRLGYKDEKMWTSAIILLFFKELDADSDGTISLEELFRFFSAEEPRGASRQLALRNPNEIADEKPADADDPEDIFGGKKGAFAESELFFKAFTVLKEMVPIETGQTALTAIAAAIRRFFSKNDAQNKGQVSEERFRAFLRRSGMLDRLTSGELRRLSECLRRRNGQSANGNCIDYEKMITNITAASTNGPTARADMVLLRLQEAAANSAAAGRPFYGLCALADPNNTGKLTKDELILTCKMMGCVITVQDLDTLKAYTPDTCFSKDGNVDYKEINYVLNNEQAGNSDLFSLGPASFSRQGHMESRYPAATAAYPSTATRGTTPFNASATPALRGNLDRSSALFSTPRGEFDRIANSSNPMLSTLPDRRPASAGGAVDDRDLSVVADRIWSGLTASRETLPRLLERDDFDATGIVAVRVFARAVEDIGLYLTSGDLRVLQGSFSGGVDRIDYHALWRYIQTGPSANRASTSSTVGLSARQPTAARTPYYITDRTLSRLADCRADGRNPRDLFESYDLDQTGMVDVWRFRELLQRLGLFGSEAHIDAAMEDFAALGQRNQICYDDFCRVLETAEKENSTSSNARSRGGATGGIAMRSADGRDSRDRDAFGTDQADRWFTRSSSPKSRRDFDVYDSLSSFKNNQRENTREREIPIALDEGSDFDRGMPADYDDRGRELRDSRDSTLRPPKTTDSREFGRSLSLRTPSNRYNTGSYGSAEDLRRSGRGLESPKVIPASTSPSRVGSKMWGSHTSLDMKGVTPRVEMGLWCCAVCLYTENSNSQDKCNICDSANYAKRPEFVVKEQCQNCTFLNGQYSSECEMCGEPLRSNGSAKRDRGYASESKDRERFGVSRR